MTRGLTFSIVFHLALIVLAFVGLPELVRPEPILDRLVVVDVVTVGSVTNAPPPAEATKKPDAPTQTTKAKPDAPRTPPPPPASAATPPPPPPKVEPPRVEAPEVAIPKVVPPAPPTARAAPPKPETPPAEPVPTAKPKPAEPVPAPKPEAVAKAEPIPLPVPKPQEAKQPDADAIPLPKPKPQEAKKPEPEPEAPKPAEAAKPEPPKTEPAKPQPESVQAADATPAPPPPVPVSRPTPPKRPAPVEAKKPEKTDDFMNVLKTVQKMKDSPSRPAETAQDAPKTTDSTANRSNFDSDRPLSVSEMDAIRQQIARCWLVPAGAKAGESLRVEIHVQMNADRTVRSAEPVDSSRMRSDPFYRAATESALRALRNPSCTPLNLPPEKYETWKSFTITFDPKDMLS